MSSYAMFKDLGEKSKNKESEGMDGVKAGTRGTGTRATGTRSSGVKPKNTMEKYDEPNKSGSTSGNQKYTVSVKDIDHKIQLIQTHKIVVIDVWAEWCQPCHMIADKYEEMAKKYNRRGVCLLAKENIDDKIQMPEKVVIRGVPTFLFFEDGVHVDSITGADLSEVEEKLQEMLHK